MYLTDQPGQPPLITATIAKLKCVDELSQHLQQRGQFFLTQVATSESTTRESYNQLWLETKALLEKEGMWKDRILRSYYTTEPEASAAAQDRQ
ncbi:MAG: hypothetical protein Q9193_004140 [Seirophora villosa]